ncbi:MULTISPECIES: ABC transporter ATP-binding protein [unclassified Oceanispirochaeta]|uniref:ABC transporter ATP-binding protein n=1 Tax=unclassified Oceanispirochaeta TaxID=2635722 RepID=UPI000E09BD1C|nr:MULTISPECIES: ABC transporter ATP-binding protein [unclassified Oceanispirochaeta]MBF9016322.1 ABC transporter ATP-binding protein [Oceanispirochaeta sp. M2]NPD72785.1 ABC transporter ATP-binding protein [Oceanispirochaeta sp. M1]RDG31629.1 ABC transporter ATP-binding protein [Oceanispirochaeta sp. M1]
MKDFLVFEGISKSFGSVQVVKDLNLSITKGEVFSLLGPSGCGKTTLLRMCGGFEEPDTGRILLNGVDITSLPPNRRPVNTVFQNYALFPHMSVGDNIAFGLKVGKPSLSLKEIGMKVEWALDLIQMAEYAHRKPSEISGGQKQRVAIARAIVNKPQLLLLDEPLAALDLKLRQKMLLELDQIHDEVGITFLFVTHDQSEAMSLSDRIAVMNLGMIEQVGSPVEIYESPKSSFTAAFIGDTNFFDGNIKSLDLVGEYSILEINGLPDANCYNDRSHKVGDHINLSVRPEKIRIHKSEPEVDDHINVLKGTVEEKVYLGAFTKYWVRCDEWLIVVLDAHRHYLLDRNPPEWDDEVWLSWQRDDGFMLHSYREKDEALLTNPDDEYSELTPDTQPGSLVQNPQDDS